MPLDPRYITTISLEEYFVDKDTGLPLAFGQIFFWQDTNRVVPLNVYTIGGAPPNYVYNLLPNPITLSAVGTPSDNNGNNVPIYYFPFDNAGNPVLYFVEVFNSQGVLQFTREGFPNTNGGAGPVPGAGNEVDNDLLNPTFAVVLFNPALGLTITAAAPGTITTTIAPYWDLICTFSGAGTVTVARNSIVGTLAYPHNPPYTLTVTPGVNVTAVTLQQRLTNNPDIFSPAAAATNGWLGTSVLLAPNSSVIVSYAPSQGGPTVLLNANNNLGLYHEFTNTVQLIPCANTDNADVGYVNINYALPANAPTTLSNCQITGLESNIPIVYDEMSVLEQINGTFAYYYNNNIINQSSNTMSSYLTGWNFFQNPAQFLSPTVAAFASGANTSNYFWDQTIIFQSANSGVAVSQAPSGAIRITAGFNTQFALVQYLPQADARKLLNTKLCANVAAVTSQVGGINATIGLYYTTGGALPSAGAGNSIVATLNATGGVATFNGVWTQVGRPTLANAPAQFTVIPNGVNNNFNDFGFSGWDTLGSAAVTTATFFAIVVGFGTLNAGQTVDIDSIGLGPGNFPARPIIKSDAEAAADCYFYWQKSFLNATIPAQAVGQDTFEYITPSTQAQGVASDLWGANQYVFCTPMLAAPTMVLFNPSVVAAAGSEIRNETRANNFTLSRTYNVNPKSFNLAATVSAGTLFADACGVHWTADSRLGV